MIRPLDNVVMTISELDQTERFGNVNATAQGRSSVLLERYKVRFPCKVCILTSPRSVIDYPDR